MDTREMILEFCRAGSSLQESRDLLLTCGYDRVDVQDALDSIVMDDSLSFRYMNAPWPTTCKIFVEQA